MMARNILKFFSPTKNNFSEHHQLQSEAATGTGKSSSASDKLLTIHRMAKWRKKWPSMQALDRHDPFARDKITTRSHGTR